MPLTVQPSPGLMMANSGPGVRLAKDAGALVGLAVEAAEPDGCLAIRGR
ncbi:MAG TPA: hypothetical protein VI793_01330 [Anaerolineales bacterium]|nr:hypothetical protein [Anaerolineales bacterium]